LVLVKQYPVRAAIRHISRVYVDTRQTGAAGECRDLDAGDAGGDGDGGEGGAVVKRAVADAGDTGGNGDGGQGCAAVEGVVADGNK